MQWQPIFRVEQLKSGMQRERDRERELARLLPYNEIFYWLQQSCLPSLPPQHNLEWVVSHFNNSDQASLTHNRHCGYSEVKWIHNGGERKDTELLRELLPRFISSCSVWRLQLSVLNVFIFYDRTEVVGWQSSYRISHNNNLKLQQYWQNIVLNGSYSKQTSHFDISNFLLCVLWSVSEFYLGLVGPHCSFLTNISFSLICFLFRVIIVISRHFLQHNMPSPAPTWSSCLSARAPGLVWPGCLAGLHRLVDVDYIAARPLPNLPWTAWPWLLLAEVCRGSCR